jgi:hypothetical protein
VPSEQLTEEAKKAEPDAAEQVEEVSLHSLVDEGISLTCQMEKKGLDPLPTQT